MNRLLRRLLVVCFCFLALGKPRVWGQDALAVKANLLEWAAAVPNLSVMADLSARPWNRSVAGITVKYRWKTAETYVPSFLFQVFELRPEYRYYWNRFYCGAYAAYDAFTVKLPSKPYGWQGNAWGTGASVGLEFPLYQFRKSALDLELGLSAGAHYTDYHGIAANEDGTGMDRSPEHTGKVLPYPELRLALVWRKTSIKDKYSGTNPMDGIYASEADAIRINFEATSRENFDAMQQGRLKFDQSSVFLDLYEGDPDAYRADYEKYLQESFVDMALDGIERSQLDDRSKRKLRKMVDSLRSKAMADFDKTLKR